MSGAPARLAKTEDDFTPTPFDIGSAEASRIAEVIGSFAPISLTELGSDSLLDRVDRKYILPLRAVPDILAGLGGAYRVLEVAGERISTYSTRYFDTPSFRLYHDHHAGRFPRFKVRLRRYGSTGEEYLEVKRRTRGGRTQKERFSLRSGTDPMVVLAEANPFSLSDTVPLRDLRPVLNVAYRRITLTGRDGLERVTVDLGLECEVGGQMRSFPGVAILEVKQGTSFDSPVVRLLRERNFRSSGISKYCLCLASLDPGVKTNRFKPALRRVAQAGGAPAWRS